MSDSELLDPSALDAPPRILTRHQAAVQAAAEAERAAAEAANPPAMAAELTPAVRALVEELVTSAAATVLEQQLEQQLEQRLEQRLQDKAKTAEEAAILAICGAMGDYRTVGHSPWFSMPLLPVLFNSMPGFADLGKGAIPTFGDRAAGCEMLDQFARKNGGQVQPSFRFELRIMATLVALLDSVLHGIGRYEDLLDKVLDHHPEQLALLKPALGGMSDLLAWAGAVAQGRYNCITAYAKGGSSSLYLAWQLHFGSAEGYQFPTDAVRGMERVLGDYQFKYHAKNAAAQRHDLENKQRSSTGNRAGSSSGSSGGGRGSGGGRRGGGRGGDGAGGQFGRERDGAGRGAGAPVV